MRLKIPAAVVLYDPGPEELRCLSVILAQTDRVYAIDNSAVRLSPTQLSAFGEESRKLVYLPQKENLGLARALNIAARLARSDGYRVLLTMDQDTRLPPDTVKRIASVYQSQSQPPGIISPTQDWMGTADVLTGTPEISADWRPEIQPATLLMTSGCLVNLAAWQAIGGYNENYFLDFVDFEFCLRLRRAGYSRWQITNLKVPHRLGNASRHNFLWRKGVIVLGRSPVRRYYVQRELLYLAREFSDDFPDIAAGFRRDFRMNLLRILLFEDRKLAKFAASWKAFRDFRRGRRGRSNSI